MIYWHRSKTSCRPPNLDRYRKMPPLKQPKDLVHLCYSSISRNVITSLRHLDDIHEIEVFIGKIPGSILEDLYSWCVISAHGVLGSEDCKNQDDKEIVAKQCGFLRKVLKVLLHPNLKSVAEKFVIDLWTLGNFEMISQFAEDIIDEAEAEDQLGLASVDEYVSENRDKFDLGHVFLEYLRAIGEHLEVFQPNFYILDRKLSDTNERQKTSLVWTNPRVVINLADNCPNVRVLNLEGYQELNDLVLEYIVGKTPHNPNQGLIHIEEITLPKKSFVTLQGHQILLESLKVLQKIIHDGKMGEIFEACQDFQPSSCLVEFSQLESLRSGGIVDVDEWLEEELGLEPWNPTEAAVKRLGECCPDLRKIRVLANDQHLEKFSDLPMGLEAIEAHVVWTGVSGLDLLCVRMRDTLTHVSLVLLEGYSWTVIAAIGKHCPAIRSFQLNIWNEYIDDLDHLEAESAGDYFPKLEELHLKCEDYVEQLSEVVFAYFFQCRGSLKIVQYIAPLSWLSDDYLQQYCQSQVFLDIEMLILKNMSAPPMPVGMATVQALLEACPRLTVLGDLRTWTHIDYYNPDSPLHYKSESEFSALKRKVVERNWDLDLDLETIDVVFSS